MNKRSFLKALLTASVAPHILLRNCDDAFKWKKSTEQLWIPAMYPYQCKFIQQVSYGYLVSSGNRMIPILFKRNS